MCFPAIYYSPCVRMEKIRKKNADGSAQIKKAAEFYHWSLVHPQASTIRCELLKRGLVALHKIESIACRLKSAKTEELDINTRFSTCFHLHKKTFKNRLRSFHSRMWGTNVLGWIQAQDAAATWIVSEPNEPPPTTTKMVPVPTISILSHEWWWCYTH